MGILLAVLTGMGLGYILERGDFCFHSLLRGVVRYPQQLGLFRAYLLAMLVAIPLVQGMIAWGWITPWVPPFLWQANIVGGVLFGAGMVVAATCVTGLFYKLGHGMLGTLVALVTWAIGDILTYRGPLAAVREGLQAAHVAAAGGDSATVLNVAGLWGGVALLVVGGLTAVWLLRSPRPARKNYWPWVPLGLAVGLFTSAAWLLAKSGGATYTFGTSGIPSSAYGVLMGESGGGNLWVPLTLISLVPGAFIAAYQAKTLWVRGETLRRYGQLAVGGGFMGIGAAVSGGCNLGHSLVGVPLLSLGSITTTLAMALGVFLADRLLRLTTTPEQAVSSRQVSGRQTVN